MNKFTISLEDSHMNIIEEIMETHNLPTKIKAIREALDSYAREHTDELSITIKINNKGKVTIDEKE